MLDKIINKEINAEIIVTFLFIIISGTYILKNYGIEKILDTLFLWMFPASIMIFLTLLLVKIIERIYSRQINKRKYVSWGE